MKQVPVGWAEHVGVLTYRAVDARATGVRFGSTRWGVECGWE